MTTPSPGPTAGPHAIAPAVAPAFGPCPGPLPGDPPPGDAGGAPRRYQTPTGEPCPRSVRVDGTVDNGDCTCCGFCLLLAGLA
jgi:hypothetical protein